MLGYVSSETVAFFSTLVFWEKIIFTCVHILNFLAFDSVTYDVIAGLKRSCCLDLEEIFVGFISDDSLVLIVEERVVEEIVEVSNDCES